MNSHDPSEREDGVPRGGKRLLKEGVEYLST
jgi:hypothetical protein